MVTVDVVVDVVVVVTRITRRTTGRVIHVDVGMWMVCDCLVCGSRLSRTGYWYHVSCLIHFVGPVQIDLAHLFSWNVVGHAIATHTRVDQSHTQHTHNAIATNNNNSINNINNKNSIT